MASTAAAPGRRPDSAAPSQPSKRGWNVTGPSTVQQINWDTPPHTSRLADLGVTSRSGRAAISNHKRMYELGGLADRATDWPKLLFGDRATQLDDDRLRYHNKLRVMFDRCHGCESLRCDHIFTFGAKFFKDKPAVGYEPSSDFISEMWETKVFALHKVKSDEHKACLKRILLVLEDDFDFDTAPLIIDLVAILTLYLSEVQTYAAIRRVIASQSTSFSLLRKTNEREPSAPRKLLPVTFISQLGLSLVFLEVIRRKDERMHRVLIQHVEEVNIWFERWLTPLLPFDRVLTMLDCLLAGDDWKLAMRMLMSLLEANRSAILSCTPSTDLTALIQGGKSIPNKLIPSFSIFTPRRAFPKRKILAEIEKQQISRTLTTAPKKDPIPHVSRECFSKSTTVLTEEAASRLIKFIPPAYRHASLRMRSLYQSEIGPMADQNLSNLYSRCESERNCSFIVVIVAKVPEGEGDLHEKKFNPKARTPSTSFYHPLVTDANYVIFGLFSPAPLMPRYSRSSSVHEVAQHESLGDENVFVFRLAPGHVSRKWSANAEMDTSSLVMCLKGGIVVGKVSNRLKKAKIGPDDDENEDEAEELKAKASSSDKDYNDGTVGPALFLDYNLVHGYSGYSESFKNDPLCIVEKDQDYAGHDSEKSSHFYFNIFAVEVFSLPKV